jgi:acylphosphatase|tara:strand:+ start:80 stop:295 length:216 start_codon:yes stop_codon:yes gene_type:complete
MKRLHLIISGRVQGVFFRHNTNKIANKLGLTGFVRNLGNRDVEVVAEGTEEKLKEPVIIIKTNQKQQKNAE